MSSFQPPDDMCEVVSILRSDGQTCNPQPSGVRIAPGTPKYIEWCRKLGQWVIMAFDLDGKYQGKQFMLSKLPDGYELYEHLRNPPTQPDTKLRTTSDVYLHGYSSNPAHKFRSPAEFLLHLVWLVSGQGSCGCKFCSSSIAGMALGHSTPNPAPEQNLEQNLDPALLQSDTKLEPGSTQSPTSKGAAGLMLTVQTKEQALDSEAKGKYLYRPGELVWFNKNVTTWGLAVIASRELVDGHASYLIQPLSHPLQHPDTEAKGHGHLRPWLAWSVPALGNQNLQNAKYDQVAWGQIVHQYPADPVVDGSILASAAIDASYSLFEEDTAALSNTGEKFYKGMYLGAEKIWVGEPVRLRGTGDGIFVLVIKKIVEVPTSRNTAEVVLIGDVYTLTRMPAPIQTRDIPARMEDDLAYRNRVEKAAERNLWNDWRIVELGAKKGLGDVKGRWYETEYLLPTLQGQKDFEESVKDGVPGDCGLWMNARGDLRTANVRKIDRLSAFGRAVPDSFRIHQGLDDLHQYSFSRNNVNG